MIATNDPDEFRASPIGRCMVGATFVTWCAAPDLVGVTLWGALDERGVDEMMAVGDFVRHPSMAPRRRSLVDCSDLERVNSAVLLAFAESNRDRVPNWTAGLERQVLVVPAGLDGILIAGTLPALGAAHPIRIVREIDAAIAYLEHPGAAAACAAIDTIVTTTCGRSVFLVRLRAELRHDLVGATLASCAAALGQSPRTLQRALGRQGTSFSDELRRARVAVAEALLVHSTLKIEAIASQVGFGNSSRMSVALRRELDVTASELRACRPAEQCVRATGRDIAF